MLWCCPGGWVAERRGFLPAQHAREPVDAAVLDGTMTRGGHIGNEQERGGQDAEENIPEPYGGGEFSIPYPKDSRVVTEHHSVNVGRQGKVVGMRAADLALACADGFQELLAICGGANRVSSPQATKRMRVASADHPNHTSTLAKSLHQIGD